MKKKEPISLEADEQEIEGSFEKGYLETAADANSSRKAAISKWAKSSLQKRRRINLRLTEHDYRAIQWKAADEGMPYQTLIASVIHKYVTGTLKDSTK